MLTIVSDCHLKFRFDLRDGRYDWFRPIYNTHLQDTFIKVNKDLMEISINSKIQRSYAQSKNAREGRLLSTSNTEPIVIWLSNSEKMLEHVTNKGEFFVEYSFGEENCCKDSISWIKNSPKSAR